MVHVPVGMYPMEDKTTSKDEATVKTEATTRAVMGTAARVIKATTAKATTAIDQVTGKTILADSGQILVVIIEVKVKDTIPRVIRVVANMEGITPARVIILLTQGIAHRTKGTVPKVPSPGITMTSTNQGQTEDTRAIKGAHGAKNL